MMAIHTSNVDPLAHQIAAVYETMLPKQPLRFVLAEGVDLHLNCRFIIHHDLCWNPSTLEQRTGRVDRLGAKAEKARDSIRVYQPYIAETQDEKMFRVVQERERWFQVVMVEKFGESEADVEKEAARVSLAAAVATELAFRMQLHEKSHQFAPPAQNSREP